MDIVADVFEIGSLLLLEGLWQNLDKVRILMADETTQLSLNAPLLIEPEASIVDGHRNRRNRAEL